MAKANDASDSAAEAAWLWKATAKGNPAAPVRLADMYVKGDGVPRSCEQAMVLLKTAAQKENALARNRLASMYSSGICVQRNRVEAYRWLSSALAANPNSEWAQQHRDQLWQQMTPEERTLAEKYR
jgi:TPR repeat protein